MSDTFGRTSPTPFAYFDPASASLRMSQHTLFEDSMSSSLTLPPSGSMRSGECYERPTLVPLIAANGSGSLLLKTPTAQLAVNGGSQHPEKRKDGGHGPTLADEVEFLLPTPRVSSANGPSQAEIDAGDPKARLETATALMPTQRATRGGSTTETTYALGGQIDYDERPQGKVLLPTPTAADSVGTRNSTQPRKPGSTAHIGDTLTDAATVLAGTRQRARADDDPHPALLPTPTARDWKDRGENVDYEAAAARGNLAGAATARFGQYAAAIERWERITCHPAADPLTEGRLNPLFVEWMMGLPPGWVTAVELDKPPATRGDGWIRNAQLRALGNGIVPQCGAAAFAILLDRLRVAA